MVLGREAGHFEVDESDRGGAVGAVGLVVEHGVLEGDIAVWASVYCTYERGRGGLFRLYGGWGLVSSMHTRKHKKDSYAPVRQPVPLHVEQP